MRPISSELVTKGEPNINSVEVHPQLSNNRHPVDDGSLVGAGSLWPTNTRVLDIRNLEHRILSSSIMTWGRLKTIFSSFFFFIIIFFNNINP